MFSGVLVVKIGEIGNVALHRGNVVADLFDCRIEFALTTAGDKNVCALCNEALRRSETDSAVASRDDGSFPSSLVTIFLLFDFILRKPPAAKRVLRVFEGVNHGGGGIRERVKPDFGLFLLPKSRRSGIDCQA